MFTGIIETTARIIQLAGRGSGALLVVDNRLAAMPKSGDSVSVSGACLTVVSANAREISFDVSPETLKRTTFSSARSGDLVNLERSLRIGEEVSGHFVAGHVDGKGEVSSLARSGDFANLSVSVPDELLVYLVPKGSIAVDGVSLTVASLDGNVFAVALIPETLSRTTLGGLSVGDEVNLETDLLGKYVVRYLALMREGGQAGGLTLERLEQLGY